jgi:hypothetical protein
MLTNPETAKQVSELMIGIYREVEKSLETVKNTSSPEDFAAYHKALKNLMCGIVMDVLGPLYKDHPSLKPLGGTSDVIVLRLETARWQRHRQLATGY